MSIFKFFNKFFPSISIEDPAGRLPDGARSILPLGLAGKLIVPDRGVPVHEESLMTFATQMDRTRRLCFVPEVPISSHDRLLRRASVDVLGCFGQNCQ